MSPTAELQGETKHRVHVSEQDKYSCGVKYVAIGSISGLTKEAKDFKHIDLNLGVNVGEDEVTGSYWNMCNVISFGNGHCIPKRYWVTFLAFYGYFLCYLLRINLSIAIVEMTSRKNITRGNETLYVKPEFNWNSMEIGFILSTFSIGHVFSFLGGFVVHKFGSVNTFGIGIGFTAILSILFPFLLHVHLMVFICGRILQGLLEGFVMSSTVDIFAHWFPPTERSLLIAVATSGFACSVAINYPVSGYVAYHFGWPAIFYTSGTATLIWCCVWLYFVGKNPSKDRFISEKERSYLKNVLNNATEEKVDIPWKEILLSKPMYALFNEYFVFAWTASFVHSSLPLYVHDVHQLNVKDVGLISGIPALCAVISQPISAYIADYLRSNMFSISKVHRIFISVGEILTLASLLAAVLCNNVVDSFICICIMRIAVGISVVSYEVICIDVAGRHASVLKAICTSCYSVGSFVSPLVLGLIVRNHSILEWNLYFVVISAVTIWSVVVFFSIGSGELQPWAVSSHEKNIRLIRQNP